MPQIPRELTLEEQQLIHNFRDKMDRFHTYTIKDGKIVVKVDDIQNRFMDLLCKDMSDFLKKQFPDFDDTDELNTPNVKDEPLPFDDAEKTSASDMKDKFLPFDPAGGVVNKKLYGKEEIKELLQCGNQKALNFLKLLFQMHYAIKIGKSYLIKAEDFDRFFEDFKGQEIVI